MVTTIQISENLRDDLLKYKKNSKTSYEEVILELLKNFKEKEKDEKSFLIEGYKEMSDLTSTMNEEWENLDLEAMKNI